MDASNFFKNIGLSTSNSTVEDIAEKSNEICSLRLNSNDEQLLKLEFSQYRKYVKQRSKLLSGHIEFSSPLGRRVFEVLDTNIKRSLSKFDHYCSTTENVLLNLRKLNKTSEPQQMSTTNKVYFHKYSYSLKQRRQRVSNIELNIKAVKCMKKMKVGIHKLELCPLCTSKIDGSYHRCSTFNKDDIVPMDFLTADEKEKLKMKIRVNVGETPKKYTRKISLPKKNSLSDSIAFKENLSLRSNDIFDYISGSTENETKDLI